MPEPTYYTDMPELIPTLFRIKITFASDKFLWAIEESRTGDRWQETAMTHVKTRGRSWKRKRAMKKALKAIREVQEAYSIPAKKTTYLTEDEVEEELDNA